MNENISTTSNTAMTTEGSDSNSISNLNRPKKRLRDEKPSSLARFKGVVLQQNGHWGAQIYANHQRIWLGTFKSEKAAAMAYDSVAIKLRSGDFHRNFPWTNLTIQEPSFQDLYTTEEVLNMIKDGSYESKFTDYIRTRSSKAATNNVLLDPTKGYINHEGVLCQKLFQKELTLSDVGKLNRLVIPKKHAIKYFPQLPKASVQGEESNDNSGGGEEVQLEFLDSRMRSWKFRYCYWMSSQSFVFTKGWNKFVKERELQAKDVVVFYNCRCKEGINEKKEFCMIDVVYNVGGENARSGFDREVSSVEGNEGKVELQLGLGEWFGDGLDVKDKKVEEDEEEREKKRIRLFGVQINS